MRVLLDAEHTEAVLDVLENNYGSIEGFKAILLPVEASLPRPEPAEEVSAKAASTEGGQSTTHKSRGIILRYSGRDKTIEGVCRNGASLCRCCFDRSAPR